MVLSTRVSIQWPPEAPYELTHTLVFTTPLNNFVDVRIFKEKYPYIQTGTKPCDFNEVFEWVIIGERKPISGTSKIIFDHSVNLQEIMMSTKTGLLILECKDVPDIGDFSEIEGSDDRRETGEMMDPSAGKVARYVEIWRSLNPMKTTPKKEVREGKNEFGSIETFSDYVECSTYDLVDASRYGRVIRLGNWIQGAIHDSSEKRHPLSVIRAYFDSHSNEWVTLIKYGILEFPSLTDVSSLKAIAGWNKVE